MHQIKRYANGRFYDTVNKNFVNRDQIAELMASGTKISIIDTKSGKDITEQIAGQIQDRQKDKQKQTGRKKTTSKKSGKSEKSEKKGAEEAVSGVARMFRKGGDTLYDYGRRYAAMWQNLMNMSRDEIDKVVNKLVKDNEISENEGSKLKAEIERYRDNVQGWVTRNIDRRINEVLNRMNLANREQVVELTQKIDALNKKIQELEKETGKSSSSRKSSAKKTTKTTA
ncbi:MAG: polyhydroxyalkanoate synthesis regulator DNA-binding domain-containing protein [Thermodesulfobacteriota bacterium]